MTPTESHRNTRSTGVADAQAAAWARGARAPGAALVVLAALAAGTAGAYPGGTPTFQTDVAPYCASCHSSVAERDLAGGGDYAAKQVLDRKHLAPILAGSKAYGELDESQRKQLVAHIQALDAASTVTLEFPAQVTAGETFNVTVNVQGGAGPVVGVALVDRAHRWYARPASAAGWRVIGRPTVIGADGRPQSDWIAKRPDSLPGITYVNITGTKSDAAAQEWATGKVVFPLRAPATPGTYPLTAVYFYGTEKASPLGSVKNPLGYVQPRGTYTGASGRVKFSTEGTINVNPPAAGVAPGAL